MNLYRIVTAGSTVDILMPDGLFWLFKRFAKVKTCKDRPISGQTLDLVVFDKAEEDQGR